MSLQAWQLSDEEWAAISPFLQDRERKNDRLAAEACLFRFFNHLAEDYRSFGWNSLPEEVLSGVSVSTVNRRFREWTGTGGWLHFWDALTELRYGPHRPPKRRNRPKADSPLSPILAELERAYDYFNRCFFGGTLPKNVVVSLEPSRSSVAGYFCSRFWRSGDTSIDHIAVSPALLGDGPDPVMAVLLHEIVHLRNDQVDIPDCNTNDQYHNRTFRDVAAIVGLECPERDRKAGYSKTVLTDRARKAIKALRFDDEIFRWTTGGRGFS